MHDGIEAMAGKDLIQHGTIGRVAHDQLSAAGTAARYPCDKFVIDDYRVPGCEQFRGDNAADVAGSASDEYDHPSPPGIRSHDAHSLAHRALSSVPPSHQPVT